MGRAARCTRARDDRPPAFGQRADTRCTGWPACGGELVGLQQRDDGTGGDGLDTPVVEQKFTLRNKHGFHARAATRFVQLVNRYSARIEVEKDGQSQDGRSVLGMLMLLAGRGASITVRCHGDDAAEVLQAIHDLIEDGFGEEV